MVTVFKAITRLTVISEWSIFFFTLLCHTALVQVFKHPILLFRNPANQNLCLLIPPKDQGGQNSTLFEWCQ